MPRIDQLENLQKLIQQREVFMQMQAQIDKLMWPVSLHAEVTRKLTPTLKEAIKIELEKITKEIEHI